MTEAETVLVSGLLPLVKTGSGLSLRPPTLGPEVSGTGVYVAVTMGVGVIVGVGVDVGVGEGVEVGVVVGSGSSTKECGVDP